MSGTTVTRNGRQTENGLRFVSNRTGKEYEENRNSDVWVINADGSGKLMKISDHDEADNQPRWSPDGKTIRLHRRDSRSRSSQDLARAGNGWIVFGSRSEQSRFNSWPIGMVG
jgi:Tol biopolymer transport system component